MAYTTIDDPTIFFNTKLYTGNGSTQSITGVGFQPDWVWLKARSSAYSHQLFDSVRGATKLLSSEESSAEQTLSGVTSFDSDGFAVGSDAGSNNNTTTFASWNWKAGGSASSNSDGSITSSVSANTTAGFSIVSYTGNATSGATIGHGLGAVPSMIIAKRRSAVENWAVYHQSRGASKYINLDRTTAEQSSTSRWNGTEPTSSVFSVNTHGSVNGNGDTYIAYCFAGKQGYSKFGSYTGNGSSSGPMVVTGFKPAMVICKASNTSGDWKIFDNKRIGYNAANYRLYPNANTVETSDSLIDILSNGFKLKTSSDSINGSGNTVIYMAFAEAPFVTAGTKAAGTAR